jgi:hypothetical protein
MKDTAARRTAHVRLTFFGGRTAIVLDAFVAALCFYDAAGLRFNKNFQDG